MLGKKDNHDIFNQYKSLLLEQSANKSFQSFIDKIKTANFDQKLKSEILELLGNPMVENAYNILHRVGDADTAGYASYPEAAPAQDDQDTVNEPDPNFGKELARERDKQQKENPEKFSDQDEEDEPMPTEAPWWIPGEEAKERWLASQQGHWRQRQREKQGQG
jgi:hypothetical protein